MRLLSWVSLPREPRRRFCLLLASCMVLLCAIPCPRAAEDPPAEGEDYVPVPGVDWIAGDCDRSGDLDLGDIMSILGHLFFGKPNSVCQASCDVNLDYDLDAADAIFLLSYIFIDGRKPPFLRDPLEVCDGQDNDCDGRVDEACVKQPTGAVTLRWRPVTRDVEGNPEKVKGYRVYYGTEPDFYPFYRDAGSSPQFHAIGLVPGSTYYFVVTAYDSNGNESGFSAVAAAVAQEQRKP